MKNYTAQFKEEALKVSDEMEYEKPVKRSVFLMEHSRIGEKALTGQSLQKR